MTAQRLMIGACLISALVAGCGEQGAGNGKSSNQTPSSTTGKSLGDKAEDAMNAVGDYASKTKDQVVSAMQDQYDQLKPKIEQLKTKAQNAGSNASAQLTKAVNQLEVRRAAFNNELEKLKNSSADTWKTVADSAHSAWMSLKEAYDNATNELTNTGAKSPD